MSMTSFITFQKRLSRIPYDHLCFRNLTGKQKNKNNSNNKKLKLCEKMINHFKNSVLMKMKYLKTQQEIGDNLSVCVLNLL